VAVKKHSPEIVGVLRQAGHEILGVYDRQVKRRREEGGMKEGGGGGGRQQVIIPLTLTITLTSYPLGFYPRALCGRWLHQGGREHSDTPKITAPKE